MKDAKFFASILPLPHDCIVWHYFTTPLPRGVQSPWKKGALATF